MRHADLVQRLLLNKQREEILKQIWYLYESTKAVIASAAKQSRAAITNGGG